MRNTASSRLSIRNTNEWWKPSKRSRLSVREEELEEHRLKKLKLHLKDEMEQIVSEYKLQHAS